MDYLFFRVFNNDDDDTDNNDDDDNRSSRYNTSRDAITDIFASSRNICRRTTSGRKLALRSG